MGSMPYVIKDNLSYIKDKLKSAGIPLGKELGSGEYGTAFESGDKVLKVTIDTTEADNNAALKSANLKHYVKVYRVFKFKDNPKLYFSLLERVKPISGKEFDVMKLYQPFIRKFNSLDKMLKEAFNDLKNKDNITDKEYKEVLDLIDKNFAIN